MRWVNIGVIVALVAVIVIFASSSRRCCLLGMATGGSVWALMRWAWQGRKETSAS